ncbi:MAG TPA: anti-sigma factor [Thermomicrobiales bacterium]|nr:anti-sigma factor [Thermomicrobiales bacterium]
MTSEDRQRVPHTEDERSAESVLEMLPAHALDALDGEDRVRVDAALAQSPELRAEFRRLLATVDELDLSVPISTPDPSLRDRIQSSIGEPAAPVSIDDRRPTMIRRLTAVAAVLVVLLGATVAYLALEILERDERIASLESPGEERSGTDFSQPLVWTEIRAEDTRSDGWGYFCRTADGSVGWIIVEDMHTSGDSIFQLWLVDDDEMVSGGTFATDDEGRGFGVVRADDPVHSFRQIWITLEPPGGSPAPTSDPDVSVPIV